MKVCHKTCVFFFFPIINKYLCMAKRSLLSRCPSYYSYKMLKLHGYVHGSAKKKFFFQEPPVSVVGSPFATFGALEDLQNV